MSAETTAAAVTLAEETKLLFQIASNVPALCRMMGIVKGASETPGKMKVGLIVMQRSWLTPHPVRGGAELQFNPDVFARVLKVCSDGERHCVLWLLNVWNSTYAKGKGWNFDLFASLNCLDSENCIGIAEWMAYPRWP